MVIAAGARFSFGDDGRIVHHAFQQPLDPRIAHGGDRRAKLGIKLLDVVLRVRQKIRKLVIARRRGNNLLERHFFLSVVELHAAANLYHVVRFEGFRQRVEVVPHFRGNRAGAVAQRQFQPGFPAALRCADLFLADEEQRSDGLPVL